MTEERLTIFLVKTDESNICSIKADNIDHGKRKTGRETYNPQHHPTPLRRGDKKKESRFQSSFAAIIPPMLFSCEKPTA